MTADPVRIAEHIRERMAKSQLGSPSINISRNGWKLILGLLEAKASPSDEDLETAIVNLIEAAVTWGLRYQEGNDPEAIDTSRKQRDEAHRALLALLNREQP